MEIFNYKGHNLTVIQTIDELLFRAKEVAEMLGYVNTEKAIRVHVDEEDIKFWRDIKKMDKETPAQKGQALKFYQDQTRFINESGIYSLILRSNKPEAKKFKRWVTSEVLPAIRKNGSYILTPEKKLEMIKETVLVFKEIGEFEERDKIFLKGKLRNNLLLTNSSNTNQRLEVPISDRIKQLGFPYKASDTKKLILISKEMAEKYEKIHGKELIKREQFVSGTTRLISCYSEHDFPLLDPIIKKYYN